MSSKDAAPEGQNAAAVDHSAAAGHQSTFDANVDNNASIDDEIKRAGNLKRISAANQNAASAANQDPHGAAEPTEDQITTSMVRQNY